MGGQILGSVVHFIELSLDVHNRVGRELLSFTCFGKGKETFLSFLICSDAFTLLFTLSSLGLLFIAGFLFCSHKQTLLGQCASSATAASNV